ncbi:hypothetical protein [Dermacoccus barathri]|uniref:Uncharacterized protein n=1 Tax=Dermacoccus barathri TaxID=322601 RepID=A0ABN2C3H0_9MICO
MARKTKHLPEDIEARIKATAEQEADALVSAAYLASEPGADAHAALPLRDALAHAAKCGHIDWLLGTLDRRLDDKGRELYGDAWDDDLHAETIARVARRSGLRPGPTPWIVESITRYALSVASLERALAGADEGTPEADDAALAVLEAEFATE